MVRKQIMALPSDPTGKCEPHEDYFDGITEGYERCKREASDIAEAREKELQERMANMIAELRGLPSKSTKVSYIVNGELKQFDTPTVLAEKIEYVINKYEVKE